MAFALTKVHAYGVEAEEPLNRQYTQYCELNITALAADVDFDLGDYTGGTFWTDIGVVSTVASTLLKVLQDIQTRSEAFLSIEGLGITDYVRATAVGAGQYTLAMDATNTQHPNIAYDAGDGPTSYKVLLSWLLKDNQIPVEASATA